MAAVRNIRERTIEDLKAKFSAANEEPRTNP
jgi:hypothetical protein